MNHTEEQRRQLEQYLAREAAAIIESSEDAIIGKTMDGIVTSWNRGAEKMYGYTAEEMIGQPITTIAPPELPDEIPSIMAKLRRGERIEHYETIRMRKDGTRLHISLQVSPIRAENGEIIGASAIARDITRLKEAEQERERLLREEHAARQQAELAQGRLELLAEVSLALSESLDPRATLQKLTGLLVPRVADICAVDLLDEEGRLLRVAAAATHPQRQHALDELTRRYEANGQSRAGQRVLETGKPLLIPELTDDVLRQMAGDEEHRRLVRQAAGTSLLAVPLSARGHPLGVLSLGMAESGRQVTGADVQLVEEVARRAALALDNARLYRQAEAEIERRRETEQLLRLVTDAMPALISYVGKDGIYRFNNKAYEKWFGQALGDITGQHWKDVLGPEAAATLGGYFEDALNGNIVDYETAVSYQGAGERYVHGQYIPDRAPSGEVRGLFILVQDISERKRAEERLNQALERMTDLYRVSRQIGTLQSASAVLDALVSTRALRHASRAIVGLFGQPWADEAPGAVQTAAVWRKDPSSPDTSGSRYALRGSALAELFKRNEPVVVPDILSEAQLVEYHARVEELGVRSAVFFPLVASDQWFGMFGAFFNFPHKVSEEDLRHMQGLVDQAASAIYNIGLLKSEAEARWEAEQANELKMTFLAMISHELRTPLTSIQGFAGTLLADDVQWDAGEQREFIEIINQEAGRLTNLVEQLLDLSRLEAGMLRIEPEPASLAELIRREEAPLRVLAGDHQLHIELPEQLPLANVDAQRILQVISNLINNAARYSPPESVITLAVSSDGESVRVDVTDEGPGIPPEEHEAIFEAFRQASNRSTAETKGAGLGLAIARGLVTAHGGRIWVAKSDGAGTTMSFTLPVWG